MSLNELTDRRAVERAMREFDKMGGDAFLKKYGFRRARNYFLRSADGKLYDSKAIAGAAHGYQYPKMGALKWGDFSGGETTVRKKLAELGFDVVFKAQPGEGVVHEFRDAEQDYLNWVSHHPEGLVVNTTRGFSLSYMPLHRASCKTISVMRANMRAGAFTEQGYAKICADELGDLLHWLYRRGGTKFTDYCSKCSPPRPPENSMPEVAFHRSLATAVEKSRKDGAEARRRRLARANRRPGLVLVMRSEFNRNPDVIAEVLELAGGYCGRCNRSAPFRRKKDGAPFLEVHHLVPLSKGGDDTVENAIALCPNCHRRAHFGPES